MKLTQKQFYELHGRYRYYRDQWKPWSNNVLHGSQVVRDSDNAGDEMTRIKKEILEKFKIDLNAHYNEQDRSFLNSLPEE